LVLAAVVGLLLGGTESPAGPASKEETTATTPAPPPTVGVVAADLLGRPVEDVQAELVGRGLQVHLLPVETADVPAGQVTVATPEGELAPATVIAVSYAVAPVPAPVVTGNGNGNGKDKDKEKDKEEDDDEGGD
jgi:serine/threonine-protein kinase